MADEARVTASLQIRKTASNGKVLVDYLSRPGAFSATVAGTSPPTPGRVEADPTGTDVSLTALADRGGFCRIMNCGAIDGDNSAEHYLEVGVWDPEFLRFYPLLEALPGETYIVRLARHMEQEYGTGTGTGSIGVGAGTTRMRLRAGSTKNVNACVEAFDP